MIVDKISKINPAFRVLVVPLDWGLGHATRCIPIINTLLEQQVEVVLAGEGNQVKILEKAYPSLVILPLKGYRVTYSRNKNSFLFKMGLQIPGIISAIQYEKRWLNRVIREHNIHAVISDNRFGLYHPSIPTIFITHQLSIETGKTWMNKIAQKINYHFINKFSECWIPDVATITNLAGKLSHPVKLPNIPVKYLGILSRFKKQPEEKKVDLLIMLSGPEPQRSIFENMILSQLSTLDGSIVLVRGLPQASKKLLSENNQLTIHDHLPAEALNTLILQSKNIVARCGYSTIMDLVVLQQKAILVPTPGQTEQEYLAGHLLKNKMFFTMSQENFSLKNALESAKNFAFTSLTGMPVLQKEIIINWIKKASSAITFQQ